jgi:hypothetical protein
MQAFAAYRVDGKKANVGLVGAHALHRLVGFFEHAPFNAQAHLGRQFARQVGRNARGLARGIEPGQHRGCPG